MSTRLYFPSTAGQPPGFACAIAAGWEVHASVDAGLGKGQLVSAKTATGVDVLTEANSGVAGEDSILLQYVSAPLAAGEISGTVKGQMLCGEEDPDMDACAQLGIRVVSGDGGTVRGTLLALHAEALSSEWRSPAGVMNRKFPLAALSPATLTAVTAQAGDRIVIEAGFRALGLAVLDGHIRVSDDGSDLPENETSTSAADPWIEFSQTLAFQGAVTTPRAGGGIGVGVGMGL